MKNLEIKNEGFVGFKVTQIPETKKAFIECATEKDIDQVTVYRYIWQATDAAMQICYDNPGYRVKLDSEIAKRGIIKCAGIQPNGKKPKIKPLLIPAPGEIPEAERNALIKIALDSL